MQNRKSIALSIVSTLWIGFIGFWCYDFIVQFRNDMLRGEILRGVGMFFVGVGIAPIGLILAAIRTNTSQEQSHTEKQRLVSEDFSRSVKLLGDASAAVRQGGIYALGFLAQESKYRHATAIKIIASYIRETGKQKKGKSETQEISIAPDGVDVEAALSVIKNRNTDWDQIPGREGEYMFDLSSSVLRYGDLSSAQVSSVNMSEIDAAGCVFAKTVFTKANMVGAMFRGCDFDNASFCGAQLRESRFWHDKHLGGMCNFRGVDLTNTELHAADLRGVEHLTQKQINSAKGDKDTKIPSEFEVPKRWLDNSDRSE